MISFAQGVLALKLIASLLSYCHAEVIDTGATGCHVTTSSTSNGFRAVFYSYTYGDTTTCYEDTFMNTGYGYRAGGPQIDANGVSDPSIYFDADEYWYATGPVLAQLYGVTVNVTNFAVELTGYFTPPEDGFYTFAMSVETPAADRPAGITSNVVDEPAVMFLGDGNGFDCCNKSSSGNQPQVLLDASPRGNPLPSVEVYLKSSERYPIRYVKVNAIDAADFGITVTTPSGTTVSTNWADYISQYEDSDVGDTCLVTTVHEPTTTTTTPWTGSGTSTTTTTVSSNSAVVIIDVPYSSTTTTTTEAWTGTVPSTTTESPSSGPGGTYTVIDYEPSSSHSGITTTTTETWTGTVPSTTTEGPPGSSGNPTVVIYEPSTSQSGSTITTTETWTGTVPSTTTERPPPGSSGNPTVVIYEPSSSQSGSTITTTETWTGTVPSTTTERQPPGSSGNPTVVVYEPSSSESSSSSGSIKIPTTTSTWTGSSVFTTLIPNPTGTGSIYLVEVPSSVTTVTSPCTGSVTSTHSTTAPNGDVIVIVETPATIFTVTTGCACEHPTTSTSSVAGDKTVIYIGVPVTTVTLTVPCTGSVPITSTVTNSGLTVIVQTPSANTGTPATDIPATATSTAISGSGNVSVYEGAANTLPELSFFALVSSLLLLILI